MIIWLVFLLAIVLLAVIAGMFIFDSIKIIRGTGFVCSNHSNREATYLEPKKFCDDCWDDWYIESLGPISEDDEVETREQIKKAREEFDESW